MISHSNKKNEVVESLKQLSASDLMQKVQNLREELTHVGNKMVIAKEEFNTAQQLLPSKLASITLSCMEGNSMQKARLLALDSQAYKNEIKRSSELEQNYNMLNLLCEKQRTKSL